MDNIRASSTNGWPSTLAFAILCAASIAIWFRPLRATLLLAIEDDRYTHLLLIIPVVLILSLMKWNQVAGERKFWICGGGLLLFSLSMVYLERSGIVSMKSDVRLAMEMLGVLAWWIGSFLMIFGVRILQSLLFPMLFLLWLIPAPRGVVNIFVAGLQRGSAVAAEFLFRVAGTPASLTGLILRLPSLNLEIAPECSSIRSSLILIVTTMALSQILLHSPWRKLLVVIAAFPLTIAKNGFRIFVLGWLATHIDPGILDSPLHHEGGVVFLALAYAVVFLLIGMFRHGEQRRLISGGTESTEDEPKSEEILIHTG